MTAPQSKLTRVTSTSPSTRESEFWLSEPEPIDDGEGDWGFAVYMDKDVWIATFSYSDQFTAMAARETMVWALQGAVFIATAES